LWVAEWHVRDETYQAALACLVDAIHAQPFTKIWGDGDTSSSDGQFFRAGGHGEARADYNAKYGSVMPARTLLSSEQRTRLFSIPTDPSEMVRHYTLGGTTSRSSRTKRRSVNRVGFGVQLCLLRYPGFGMGPAARCRTRACADVSCDYHEEAPMWAR